MSAEQITSLVRRKVQSGRESYAARAMTLARALRLTAARQSDKLMDLPLSVVGLTEGVLDGPRLDGALGADGLLLLMEGSGGRAGLVEMDPTLVAGLIQQQTMGRILPRAEGDTPRRPTATDAALCEPFVEKLLSCAAEMVDLPSDRAMLAGYRFGVHAEDVRTACLALDKPEYHSVEMMIDLAGGKGGGTLRLVLPPPPPSKVVSEEDNEESDTPPAPKTLSDSVLELHAELTIALTQMTIPLKQISGWAPGDVITLDTSSLRHAMVMDANGRAVSRGTLGQLDGARAVQLEQRPKPHIHPRRRRSDRAELDLPQVSGPIARKASTPESEEKVAVDDGVDVFGGAEDMPDMSDLNFEDDAQAPDQAENGLPEERRREAAGW